MVKGTIGNQRLMKFQNMADSVCDRPSAGHYYNARFSEKYIKGKRLLSIGSWTGLYESIIKNLPSEITAIDIESKALSVLKKRIPRAYIKKAFSHNLPFANSSFDAVTFWAVLEHIPIGYELSSFQEIRRVLKKGGVLFISTMNKSIYSDILDPAYWLTGHRHYREKDLVSMLKDANFKSERIEKHGSFIVAFDAILFYLCKHIFHTDRPGFKFYQRMVTEDYNKKGFYEIAIRARAT